MITVDAVEDVVGKVIREHPYVKILAKPRLETYEVIPGLTVDRWEALAQVGGMLAIVELTVTEGRR